MIQVGAIILQPLSNDIKSLAIAVHSLTMLEHPHYAHCGVYIGDGKMIAASGKVELQDEGATGNIAVPYAWKSWSKAQNFLFSQVGKRYDWFAWAACAVEPIARLAHLPHERPVGHAYTCSSIVAAALAQDGPVPEYLNRRTVTPDDIARFLQI